MTLVDTSAWIEFLRNTDTRATRYVHERLGHEIAVTEPIMLELLVGTRPGMATQRLERLLLSQTWHTVEPAQDYRAAVDVFHATRATGRQPRSVQDCVIAAVALRTDEVLAHRDADFEHIAHATGLQVVDLRE